MTKIEKQARKAADQARAARIAIELDRVNAAILAGTAYIDTFVGRRMVKSYCHETGWVQTTKPGCTDASWIHQQSFMVCTSDIKSA